MAYTPPKNYPNSSPTRESLYIPDINQDLIIKAINNRQCLEFFYDGCYRKVEPHTCGIFSTGTKVLICWQTAGSSNSGQINCWKTFNLKKIQSLKHSSEKFHHARPKYNPNDYKLKSVFAKI